MRRRRTRSGSRRAFTLLEVMIAVTIFGITLAAIFMTFRTGITAWRTSHVASETFQSARQAQEVMMSDLTRCFFMPERFYNLTFNTQLQQLENYEAVHREAAGLPEDERDDFTASVQDPGLNAETLAKPVNLTFIGTDSGQLDEIEFARRQSAWIGRGDYTWGVRRVRYYVREGVLYREEKEPFGLPDGQSVLEFVQARFQGLEESDTLNAQRNASLQAFSPDDMERFEAAPAIVEPLCDGVELFNLTYGLYKGGKWIEVNDWHSGEYKYRFPEDELQGTMDMGGVAQAGSPLSPLGNTGFGQTETAYTPSFGGQLRQRVAILGGQTVNFQVEQDDLPAYCAIQMGVRESSEGGRLHSFTFFFSLAEAQERLDASLLDSMESYGVTLPGQR